MKTGRALRPLFALASVLATGFAFAGCTGESDTPSNSGGSSSGGSAGSVGGTQTTGGTITGGSPSGGAGGAVSTGGALTGGTGAGGASQGGASATGGTSGSGGAPLGGTGAGGAATGGASTGGDGVGGAGTGGTGPGGAGIGGTATAGAGTGGRGGSGSGSGGKGASGGTGGAVVNTTGPCDLYGSATPCVAAYSTVRRLASTYTGPLYQIRKGGTMTTDGTGANMKTGVRAGGTTQDIGQVDGFANSATQDTFCGTEACTVSIVYDQSGRNNHLRVAPAGCYDDGSANLPDFESNAKGRSLMVGGRKVYALYTNTREGYRNNAPTAMPMDTSPQGIYMVADGKRYGSACCWDFGNASKDNCYGTTGIMDALFLGTGYWGRGTGAGPWFMADFEGGVWAGGSGASNATNNNLPSSNIDYAFGILKATSTNYAIRVGNAQSGSLTTAYDGNTPKTLRRNGAIILGIGGDNSNHSIGTFFEGVITAGRPSDAVDASVLQNVQAVGYGR